MSEDEKLEEIFKRLKYPPPEPDEIYSSGLDAWTKLMTDEIDKEILEQLMKISRESK